MLDTKMIVKILRLTAKKHCTFFFALLFFLITMQVQTTKPMPPHTLKILSCCTFAGCASFFNNKITQHKSTRWLASKTNTDAQDLADWCVLGPLCWASSYMCKQKMVHNCLKATAVLAPVIRIIATSNTWNKMLKHIPYIGKSLVCTDTACQGVCNKCKYRLIYKEAPIAFALDVLPKVMYQAMQRKKPAVQQAQVAAAPQVQVQPNQQQTQHETLSQQQPIQAIQQPAPAPITAQDQSDAHATPQVPLQQPPALAPQPAVQQPQVASVPQINAQQNQPHIQPEVISQQQPVQAIQPEPAPIVVQDQTDAHVAPQPPAPEPQPIVQQSQVAPAPQILAQQNQQPLALNICPPINLPLEEQREIISNIQAGCIICRLEAHRPAELIAICNQNQNHIFCQICLGNESACPSCSQTLTLHRISS